MPALLGIPAVISGFGSLFSGFLSYFAAIKAAKIAFFLFVMTSIYLGTTLLFDQFSGWLGQLALSAPPYASGVALFLPSNTVSCITIILAAESACALFRVSKYILEKQWDAVKEL